jgi:hypothetical protein
MAGAKQKEPLVITNLFRYVDAAIAGMADEMMELIQHGRA